jgi:periplasmic protein TonB
MARDGLRSHLSGSLPISIAVHAVALIALFVIPLVANVVVPTVMTDPDEYILAKPAPPPPDVIRVSPPQRSAERARTDTPAPIPTEAPPTIEPERASPPSYAIGPVPPDSSAIGEPGGLPTGLVSSSAPPRPPDPPRPAGPVRVADLPVAPRKTVDVRPIYPDIARMARKEGTVVMEAVLDPSGHVTQLRVIRSVPMLDEAALDAVRQWRYTPSLYGGRPVSVLMTITIRFTLQ